MGSSSMLKAQLISVLGHLVRVTGLPLLSAAPWPHLAQLAQNRTHRGHIQTAVQGTQRGPQRRAVSAGCLEPVGQPTAKLKFPDTGQSGNSHALLTPTCLPVVPELGQAPLCEPPASRGPTAKSQQSWKDAQRASSQPHLYTQGNRGPWVGEGLTLLARSTIRKLTLALLPYGSMLHPCPVPMQHIQCVQEHP